MPSPVNLSAGQHGESRRRKDLARDRDDSIDFIPLNVPVQLLSKSAEAAGRLSSSPCKRGDVEEGHAITAQDTFEEVDGGFGIGLYFSASLAIRVVERRSGGKKRVA